MIFCLLDSFTICVLHRQTTTYIHIIIHTLGLGWVRNFMGWVRQALSVRIFEHRVKIGSKFGVQNAAF